MNQYAINLKNLYRLLTVNDYLLFSNGVLPVRYRSGMTLTSFWREILLPEWQSGIFGTELWRKERSRYLSDFCNRKSSVPFYEEYLEEILQSLDRERMTAQAERAADYLAVRHYDASLFRRKIECMLQASPEEGFLTKSDCHYLMNRYSDGKNDDVPAEFRDGWIFSVLSLCAMCGKPSYAARLLRIVRSRTFEPAVLSDYIKKNGTGALLLPGARSVYGAAEDPLTFFGRQQELYDLTEAVKSRRKIFISGIGGIGKTELLRQLLVYLQKPENRLYAIPLRYRESLPESLMGCFALSSSLTPREGFCECIRRIAALQNLTPVLLLDNAEVSPEEAEYWSALAALSCAVVVTSRGKAPEGFQELSLGGLNEEAALLMLRRHYEKALSEQEMQRLSAQIRQSPLMKHPLTIRLVALSANRNGWSGLKMAETLEQHGDASAALLSPQIRMIYKKLYAEEKLEEAERRLLDTLSCLPYQQYPTARLQQFCLRDHTPAETEQLLDALNRKGWIEKKDGSFSLHPLIAECLAERGFPEERLADFLTYAQDLIGSYLPDYMMYDEKYEVCRLLFGLMKHIRGSLSDQTVRLLCLACLTEQNLSRRRDRYEQISGILSSCRPETAENRFLIALTDACYGKTVSARELNDRFAAFCRESPDRSLALSCGNLLLHYYLYLSTEQNAVRPVMALCEELAQSAEEHFCLHYMAYAVAERSYHSTEADQLFERISADIREVRGEKAEQRTQTLMQMACVQRALYTLFVGRNEVSEKAFRQRLLYPKAVSSTNYRQQELSYRAHSARIRKKYAEAIALFQELIDSHRHFDGADNINVRIQEVELAKVYKESGQISEAIALYEEATRAVEKNYPNYAGLYAMHCQLAGAYLEVGASEKALVLLGADEQRIQDRNGAVYAEECYLLSKAYRLKGDTADEEAWLLKADPLMQVCYQADHPKREYVRERLKEIRLSRDDSVHS